MKKRTTIALVAVAGGAAMALLSAPARADTSVHLQIGAPGYVYTQPGYVVHQQPRYVHAPGYGYRGPAYGHGGYRRGLRDSDRDGVPDRFDRDRDNDGRPNYRDRDRDGDGVPNRWDRRPDNRRRY